MNLRTLSTERLKAFVKSHGKVANQRLVALEKAGLETYPAYQYISSRLSSDKTSLSKSGHLKLNIGVRGKSRNELLEIATIIDNFEKAKTSTIGGIRKIYEKMKSKTEEKTGVQFTNEQFGRIWTNVAVESFISKFGSKQFVKLIKRFGIEEALNICQYVYEKNFDTLYEVEEFMKQKYDSTVDYNF